MLTEHVCDWRRSQTGLDFVLSVLMVLMVEDGSFPDHRQLDHIYCVWGQLVDSLLGGRWASCVNIHSLSVNTEVWHDSKTFSLFLLLWDRPADRRQDQSLSGYWSANWASMQHYWIQITSLLSWMHLQQLHFLFRSSDKVTLVDCVDSTFLLILSEFVDFFLPADEVSQKKCYRSDSD